MVSCKSDDSPMYEVKPEAGSGGSRILHRNLLFPCNYLPIDISIKSYCSQKRAGRVQKDKCSKVEQIPTPQVKKQTKKIMHLDFHWIPRVKNEYFQDCTVYHMNRRC